jgi:hypothetical protein
MHILIDNLELLLLLLLLIIYYYDYYYDGDAKINYVTRITREIIQNECCN